MDATFRKTPKVRISYDEMEAYLLLPAPFNGERYTLSEIKEKLEATGVKVGIDENKISAMLRDGLYEYECLIAEGIPVVHGEDAYYEYSFDTNFNKKPTHREDGSVDYWSIHSFELVEEGQVIATYVEPVEGSNGMTVKGKLLPAKKARPLPPLTGKGFSRSADNKTYTSDMTGKIEMQGNRILISAVHEVQGDVGLKTGNIDFRGDVIIHGNVPTGAVVKASGTITIDGTVEGAILDANKDIIIRGGMLGGNKGLIRTKGDLSAKFLEYTTVKAEGNIVAGALINCDITTNGKVLLKGKHASIVGGVVHAATGIEAYNFGNEYGVKTEIYTGVNMEVKKQLTYHEDCIKEAQDILDKINIGLKQLDDLAKTGVDMKNDPRKASLLRTKIVKQADLAAHIQQLNYMSDIVENAHGASVRVIQNIHNGVTIGINDAVLHVKEDQSSVAFHERDSKIVMFSLKGEVI